MTTWNVFCGCKFNCTYCDARKLAETRLRNSPRYIMGFVPHLVPSELWKNFKPGEWVFVCYMGDVFWAESKDLDQIISNTYRNPLAKFLFMSKDPRCFDAWERAGHQLPVNAYIGTTLETNRWHPELSEAPAPETRAAAMMTSTHPNKLISIEPVMDFDLPELVSWVKAIQPQLVYIGADNYHNDLPEPPWDKLQELINKLRSYCPEVIEKPGLERLKGGSNA